MKSSLLHPHDLSSPSLPKIKCAFHPEELLTNFCKAKECFLPLCPSCITIHISEHITMKTTPIIENISDSIRTLHQQLESYSEKTNGLYKQFVEGESKVDQFRQKVKGKIQNAKHDFISMIQDHFRRIEIISTQRINDLKYVKTLLKYKDYAKKIILSLKHTEKNFFTEENKIMRMMIKFQVNDVQSQLDQFCRQSQLFLSMAHPSSLSTNINDLSSQLSADFLQNMFKIDFQQPTVVHEPKDIVPIIKQLYEKPQEKKQNLKLNKFASSKNTPVKPSNSYQDQNLKKYQTLQPDLQEFSELISSKKQMSVSHVCPDLKERTDLSNQYQFVAPSSFNIVKGNSYSSVKESITKATQDFNQIICRNSKLQNSIEPVRGRRTSFSRGKGISLIHNNFMTIDAQGRGGGLLKADLNLSMINSKTQKFPRKFR